MFVQVMSPVSYQKSLILRLQDLKNSNQWVHITQLPDKKKILNFKKVILTYYYFKRVVFKKLWRILPNFNNNKLNNTTKKKIRKASASGVVQH